MVDPLSTLPAGRRDSLARSAKNTSHLARSGLQTIGIAQGDLKGLPEATESCYYADRPRRTQLTLTQRSHASDAVLFY